MSALERFERIRYLRARAAEYIALASEPCDIEVRNRYSRIAGHYIALAESELRSDKLERQQKLEELRLKRTAKAAGRQPAAEDLRLRDNRSDEQTDNPPYADERNFYKVEKWTKDGAKVDRLLYAGNNLEQARQLFANAVKHRPRVRLTIRRRTRVIDRWPQE